MGSIGIKIAQSLFQCRLQDAARETIHEMADTDGRLQREVEQQLKRLGNKEEAIVVGTTSWGFPVSIPTSLLINHGIICGATGVGKSCSALLMLVHALERFPSGGNYLSMGFGDPKRDLGPKALEYISARAYRLNEKQRERLREKVWIMDVMQSDYVTPYNILACQHMSAELLVNNRIEMICKMYGRGSSAVTTRMKS
ncbi:MAG: hypothetical protein L0287_01430, partial [Anaerolineae bacterium]|nr:hypothetical protein [Anaerolineae bacterium]